MSIFKDRMILSFLIILGLSPVSIIMLEASTFEDPMLLGVHWNPYPKYWEASLIISSIMIFLGLLHLCLTSRKITKDNRTYPIIILLSTLAFIIIIWMMIGFSVEEVGLIYVKSWGANPLNIIGFAVSLQDYLSDLLFSVVPNLNWKYLTIGLVLSFALVLVTIKKISILKS